MKFFLLLCTKKTTCVPHGEWEAWNGGQDLVTEASLATPLPGVDICICPDFMAETEGSVERNKKFS